MKKEPITVSRPKDKHFQKGIYDIHINHKLKPGQSIVGHVDRHGVCTSKVINRPENV